MQEEKLKVTKEILEKCRENGITIDYLLDIVNSVINDKIEIVEGVESVTSETEQEVYNFFEEIRLSPHVRGYNFWKTAVIEALKNQKVVENMTKLYEMIAKKYGTTALRVERAMRYTIDTTWNNKENAEVLYSYFGRVSSRKEGKPSNSVFLVKTIRILQYSK